jgi:iron complex outermembrane receptor protein
MIDYELAIKSAYKSNTVKINGYYMDYQNQLVLSGAINDVGTALRVNVPSSYRTGIELETEFLLLNKVVNNKSIHQLRFIANASFSQNRIKSTTITWLDYATYTNVDSTFTETPISYSPNTVVAAGFHYTFRFSHFEQTKPSQTLTIAWMQKYVSKQFLDNTGDETRSIPQYHVGELNLMYQPNSKISVKLQVQNIFNSRYLNNAYTWGYFYGNRNLVQEVFVFPSAPTNLMVGASYKF